MDIWLAHDLFQFTLQIEGGDAFKPPPTQFEHGFQNKIRAILEDDPRSMAFYQCLGNPIPSFMKTALPVTLVADPCLGESARQDVLGLYGLLESAGKVRLGLLTSVDVRKDDP